MSYAYALMKEGQLVSGGSKRYHVMHELTDERATSIEMLRVGLWTVWRLSSRSAADITDDITKLLIEGKYS